MIEIVAILSIAIGLIFFITGSIGLIRLPDVFSRLHALAKADNVGLAFITLGVCLLEQDPFNIIKIVLIWLFILAASAVSAHLISSHALKKGDHHD
jgi:multicomponent Na+:H+ antiporter subunit G